MSATHIDLLVEQGATFETSMIFLDDNEAPIDFTGCTARMQARVNPSDASPLIELSTANGRISLSNAGVIALTIDAATTAALTVGGSYDLFVTFPAGDVERMLFGAFALALAVTR